MKKILIKAVSIIAVILISWNCSKGTNPITSDKEALTLEGKWTEEFAWSSKLFVVLGGGKFEDSLMVKTTTIDFQGNNFEIKILPPTRIITQKNDSIYVTVSPDTLYRGTYSTSGDTLKFHFSQQENPTLFRYQLEKDSLHIQQFSSRDSSGFWTISIGSFLWDRTSFKNAGVFARQK